MAIVKIDKTEEPFQINDDFKHPFTDDEVINVLIEKINEIIDHINGE